MGGSGSSLALQITGLAGVGKTALVREAVRQLENDHAVFPGGVVWVKCQGLSGNEGQAELWARIARSIGADKVAKLSTESEARRTALSAVLASPNRRRLLIILDDVGPGLDMPLVIDTLTSRNVSLLITSRYEVAPDRVVALILHELSPSEAKDLIERLTSQDTHQLSADDIEKLRQASRA
jgi:hypothetical protein